MLGSTRGGCLSTRSLVSGPILSHLPPDGCQYFAGDVDDDENDFDDEDEGEYDDEDDEDDDDDQGEDEVRPPAPRVCRMTFFEFLSEASSVDRVTMMGRTTRRTRIR